MAIETFETVLLTAIFIIPGFIMDGTISLFIPPKKRGEGLHFLTFLLYSILHCAIWSWLYIIIWNIKENDIKLFFFILCLVAITLSFLLGILIGLIKKHQLVRKILNKLHCNISHDIETSWDYIFSKQTAGYVVVLLKDDSEIFGWFGENSFSSSISDERDIFIEKCYTEKWELIEGTQGIYIAKDEIKTINFYEGDIHNGKQK